MMLTEVTVEHGQHINSAPLSTAATVKYDPRNMRTRARKWYAIAHVDRQLVRYYQWWIWREFRIKITDSAWKPHATLIRGEKPRKPLLWNLHEGHKVQVSYSPKLLTNGNHWWLPACSTDLENIRTELGLRARPYVPFHITIGNQVY